MKNLLANTVAIASHEEYDRAMAYLNALIAEATEKGFLSSPDADNEYTREVGRVGSLCADFEDRQVAFSHITVRGRAPQAGVAQAEVPRHDRRQKGAFFLHLHAPKNKRVCAYTAKDW